MPRLGRGLISHFSEVTIADKTNQTLHMFGASDLLKTKYEFLVAALNLGITFSQIALVEHLRPECSFLKPADRQSKIARNGQNALTAYRNIRSHRLQLDGDLDGEVDTKTLDKLLADLRGNLRQLGHYV